METEELISRRTSADFASLYILQLDELDERELNSFNLQKKLSEIKEEHAKKQFPRIRRSRSGRIQRKEEEKAPWSSRDRSTRSSYLRQNKKMEEIQPIKKAEPKKAKPPSIAAKLKELEQEKQEARELAEQLYDSSPRSRLNLMRTAGLSLTLKNKINMKSKKGKLVQSFLDEKEQEAHCNGKLGRDPEEQKKVQEDEEDYGFESGPILKNRDGDRTSAMLKEQGKARESYELFKNRCRWDKSYQKKMVQFTSIRTGLRTWEKVFSLLDQDNLFDPFPYNQNFDFNREEDGVLVHWPQKKDVFLNPPWSFPGIGLVLLHKQYHNWLETGQQSLMLLPIGQVQKCSGLFQYLLEVPGFYQENLGKLIFGGYSSPLPQECILLGFLRAGPG